MRGFIARDREERTIKNILRNMEKKIERLTSNDKVKEELWVQLRKKGYGRRKKRE